MDTSLLEQLMGTHYLRINLLKNLGDLFITGFYRKKSDGTIQWISLKYECIPDICFNCGKLGYFSNLCLVPRGKPDSKAIERTTAFSHWLKASLPKKSLSYILLFLTCNKTQFALFLGCMAQVTNTDSIKILPHTILKRREDITNLIVDESSSGMRRSSEISLECAVTSISTQLS